MFHFLLVRRQRKISLVFQFGLFFALSAALSSGLIGNVFPANFWVAILVFLGTSILVNTVRILTISTYRRRHDIAVGDRDNFVLGIDSLANLVIGVATFFGTLVAFNIAFQTFFTSISLVAVALVLIFRDYISNYLDSFRLMFSTDFSIGNYIKVSETTKGVISDISFRATKLKTDDGDVLYIPNTKLITSEVVNYSKAKYKRISVPFSLPTEVVHPVATLEQELSDHLLKSFPDLVQEKKIFLRVLNIKEWHTDFALEVSVDQFNFVIETRIVKEVYTRVLQYEADNAYRRPAQHMVVSKSSDEVA